MKGVEAIIAIILILMIVIALAALAYTWFSGMFSSLTGSAQTSIDTTNVAMSTNYKIETAKNMTGLAGYNVTVTVRNIGTQSINVSKWSAYINEELYRSTGNASSIPYGTVVVFYVVNVSNAPVAQYSGLDHNPPGKRLKLVTETGLEQSLTIT